MQHPVHIVGGGLAGTEAALLLADAGADVVLHEQKPERRSPAHKEDGLAELVCSNSLRSDNPHNAIGLLHEELRRLGSPVLAQADRARVPAGDALAVDRVAFSGGLTAQVRAHPRIRLSSEEVRELPAGPEPCIVATGPLTSEALARSLAQAVGASQLAFYDAIAPIVAGDPVDSDVAFACGGAAAARGQGGYGLEPRRLPDAAHLAGAEADLLQPHSGVGEGGVGAARAGPPQYLPERPARDRAGRVVESAAARVLRRADHRGRRLRRERRLRTRRGAPRSRAAAWNGIRAAARDHRDRRPSPARQRRGPPRRLRVPADQRRLRAVPTARRTAQEARAQAAHAGSGAARSHCLGGGAAHAARSRTGHKVFERTAAVRTASAAGDADYARGVHRPARVKCVLVLLAPPTRSRRPAASSRPAWRAA